jgi:hypothetical protein
MANHWLTLFTFLIFIAVISAQDFAYLIAVLGYPSCAVNFAPLSVKETNRKIHLLSVRETG